MTAIVHFTARQKGEYVSQKSFIYVDLKGLV